MNRTSCDMYFSVPMWKQQQCNFTLVVSGNEMFCLRILKQQMCNILSSKMFICNPKWRKSEGPSQSTWYQHDETSQGVNKGRCHTNRPGGLHLLCWRQADVHTSHFYQYCVIEVTKAIFFLVHKAGDLSSSGCFAFFHVMTEWWVLYTCDATWTLLQNRNHRHSMFCRYLNCHIGSVTLKPMFWSVGTSITVFSVHQS